MATTKEMAYDLKLSLPTITQNLEFLAEQGMIASEKKVATKSGGRNPIAHSYVPDVKVAIGLDVAKHHIISTIIDLSGNVVKYVYKRQSYERSDDYLKLLGDTVEEIIESVRLDRSKILGVGIAMPGLVSHELDYVVDGRVIDNAGMTCKEASKYIPYPTKLIHDSYASGYSESWMASEIHNLFYISLCDTVGGSVLVNDKIYMGEGLYSGEIGHLKIVPDGKQCYCGQKGCFDSYCNAEVLSMHADGDLELFFERLEQGDEKLQEVWDEYLEYLAQVIIDARMMYGCKIILGGYVGVHMEGHMDALYEKVDPKSPFSEKAKDYVLPCKKKKSSVATGAALYFVDQFFNNM
ncbi:ROK family protein [Anaerotalea alkaliphila]|uniref:ROK family protein n=1 Tax=Anaerotalea alkaliphila TaxID=2662126 RepID=A0A7X5KPM3_9FIRM|nr:ROK family protein [Anaerotalea alkaliphila]NDL68357.1 ROK family protein [Anaerotalea alkaliphila]